MCNLYRTVGFSRMNLQRIHQIRGGSVVREVISAYRDALAREHFRDDGRVVGRSLTG